MEIWDYDKEEDYSCPLTTYNKWATLKNTEFRCREIALEHEYKYQHRLPLSEILRYFKYRGTSYGLLFRWKGEKRASSFIESEINKYRKEYGVDGKISIEVDYISKKPKKNKVKRNHISGNMRQNVLMRDNYTCQICGATVKDGAKLEIDHIIPKSKGGSDDENNLQVLCRQCNREKHNRTDLLHDKLKKAELESV